MYPSYLFNFSILIRFLSISRGWRSTRIWKICSIWCDSCRCGCSKNSTKSFGSTQTRWPTNMPCRGRILHAIFNTSKILTTLHDVWLMKWKRFVVKKISFILRNLFVHFQYDKDEKGEVHKTKLMAVMYVPLCDYNRWLRLPQCCFII